MSFMPDAALLSAVDMIKLTENREIEPYSWVQPGRGS
jgi:hypothetical protein